MTLIKCKECGQEVSDKAKSCPKCGAPVERMISCAECGTQMSENINSCPNCGCPNPLISGENARLYTHSNNGTSTSSDVFAPGRSGKSRGAFALLAIFLGCLGVHFFYIGKTGAGVTNLVICMFSWILLFIPLGVLGVLTLIQGILALTMTEEEFERRYIISTSSYPF